MFKLYVYDHCPYCTRARAIFGYKNIPVEVKYLLNDDEEAHIEKIGQKMVPILQKEDGSYMAESGDIVHYIDQLDGAPILVNKTSEEINAWVKETSGDIRGLTMPRWCLSDMPEFKTASARAYFMIKKEEYIGAFGENIQRTAQMIAQVEKRLAILDAILPEEGCIHGEEPSFDDIILFAFLRSLTIVKDLTWPKNVRNYLIHQSELTKIWLFDAYAF